MSDHPEARVVCDAARVARRIGLLNPDRFQDPSEAQAARHLLIALRLLDAALPLSPNNAPASPPRWETP